VLFNEPKLLKLEGYIAEAVAWGSFSALQRAEIAEIHQPSPSRSRPPSVSVLFNEPKLLKFTPLNTATYRLVSFSALQRAEIAEIGR